ncbi:MAG: four helix bundle protein [Candidatus Peribacteraceae bacterium]|nr:four helix bundle protein [Candidatus Peribacteraceae bacterium]
MTSFTDLTVWQRAMDLIAEVHAITENFPASDGSGLAKQLRSSSKSIVGNLAEGCGRYTFPDKANKFVIARGECSETKGHLLVAVRLKFVTPERAARALELTSEVGKMLSGLIKSCHRRSLITNN